MSVLIPIILLSFFSTYFLLPIWIKKCRQYNLVSKDMHKLKSKKVANGGGLIVLLGIVIGILSYIGLNTFYFKNSTNLIEIFALLSVILISAIVGLIDDLLGWKEGLSKKLRIALILFAAIPLMVINAGQSTMMGIHFGILYPLLLIPLGIVATSTTFNFLAGYNGLEASQGILIIGSLSIISWLTGSSWLTVIGLCTTASLLAFYIFNKTPAEVFPGDVLTYPIGALIGVMAILGNFEKVAVIIFIPYILEVILKVRGKLKKESFAKLNKDGTLKLPYNKFYGLEHVAIWILGKIKPSKKVHEKEVVLLINLFQIICIIIGFFFLI